MVPGVNLEERNRREADHACEMVLKIVQYVAHGHRLATAPLEPASLPVYDASMAPWVEKRSDKRKVR